MDRPKPIAPLREYPVDGGLYPVEGRAELIPPLIFDGPPSPLLPEVTPVGRFNAVCSELRLRIEDAPLLASRELNPLVDLLAKAFPRDLLAGSIVPNPLDLESQKWFEINLRFP